MPNVSSELDVLDAVPAIVWRADAETGVLSFVSSAAEDILGFPVERWLEDPGFRASRLHPDDQWVIAAWREKIAAGTDYELVYRMIAADERVVWLREKVKLRVSGGRTELCGVMMDVSGARESAVALAQSEENHRRMLELLPTGVAVHVDGVIVFVNDSLARTLGASDVSEVIGRRAVDFVRPDEQGEVLERQAALRDGRAVPFQRRVLIGLNGERVHVEVAAVPVVYDGKPAAQLVVRDLRELNELLAVNKRLAMFAAGMNQAMWEWDLTTGELWANQAHYELFQPIGNQGKYDDWVERIHPDDRKRVLERSNRVREIVAPKWSDEYRFRFPDGNYGWVLDRGSVFPGPDGKAQRMLGEMLDITQIRKAEEERRTAELRLRTVLENSLLGAYVIRSGRFQYVNPVGAAMFGYEPHELMKLENLDVLFHDEERATAALWAEATVPARFTARCRHRSGREIIIEFSGSASSIDGYAVTAGTMVDMTEQHRVLRELERSERQYSDLVEQLRDVVYSFDLEGRITSLNPAFENLTGFRPEEWIGRAFVDIVLPESVEAAVDHFTKTVAGATDIIGQYRIRSKEKGVVDIEATGHPKIVDGAIVGVVGTVRDVTMRNLLERRLEETKRLASLGQLAASMAHEFNNVLMGIQPFVEVTAREAAAIPRVVDGCRHMLQSLSRGKSVSQQILRYANPKPSELQPVEIATWLRDAIDQSSATLPQEIVVREWIDPSCSGVLADPAQLEQVFINLLYNARDAMAGSGAIFVEVTPVDGRSMRELSLDPAAEYVRITVADDGPGIPPDVLPRIFDPLFTTKRNGTGLGLSIARKLLEGQSGAITVESTPGNGARFHLFLRACAHEAQRSAAKHESDPGLRRVLLIEDEPIVAMGVCAMLEQAGIAADHVAEGYLAFDAVAASSPDALIVDVNLPDINGIELCKQLRERWPDMPIVIATGHLDLHEYADVVSLLKPYSLTELLTALDQARRTAKAA